MRVKPSSYRDENNNIVDDLRVEGSVFDRIVVLRDDGTVTVRAKTQDKGEVVEEQFERTNRQYSGLSHGGGPTAAVHDDIEQALFSVGYCIEPSDLFVERNSEPNESGTTDTNGENNSMSVSETEGDGA